MKWIQKIWPSRANAKSKQGLDGALVPAYGQDLQYPEELINRANKRAVKGDLDGAIADFDAAIELNPAKATTFYNRGYLNNLAGNHEQALRDCTEAIALLPDYDEAFYQRGVAHQDLGDLDAAIVDFSEVLRLNPYSIKAYYKRASCYAARDDVQGAVADYTQAILRVPKDANAYLQRGIFLTKLQEYRTAVADFSSALSFNPKNADAYYHRGYCYAELDEKEKATQDFNQAMLYDPSQRVADYNRSYALGILKDTKNLPPASASTVTTADQAFMVEGDEAVVLSLHAEPQTILTTDVPNLSLRQAAEAADARAATSSDPAQSLEVKPEVKTPTDTEGKEDAFASPDLVAEVAQIQTDSPPAASLLVSEPLPMAQTSVPPATIVSVPEPEFSGSLVLHSEVEALFAQAQNQAESNQLEAAIATYSKIIAYEPENARAYFDRGKLLNQIGQGVDASLDLDTAVHLAKRKSLDLMKDFNNRLTETLAELKGGLEWETHPSSALLYSPENNQSIEGAILKYSQLIHRNPLDVHAYFERAKSRALLGDLEGAIADYTRTISLDEQYRDAYYKRGMLRSALGDIDGATQDMNKAILRKPLLPAASSITAMRSSVPVVPPEFREPLETETVQEHEVLIDVDRLQSADLPPPVNPAWVTSSAPEEMDFQDPIAAEFSPQASMPIEEAEVIPTYFSDLVLAPCTHEGNDPTHRFCIHCGQPIAPRI